MTDVMTPPAVELASALVAEAMQSESESRLSSLNTPKSMARRDFLKLAALAGTSALAMGTLTASAQSNTTTTPAKPQNIGQQLLNELMKTLQTPPATTPAPGTGPTTSAPSTTPSTPTTATSPTSKYDASALIVAKTFPNLSTVEGISQNQLTQHLGLYQGYVKQINEVQTKINGYNPDINPREFRALHLDQSFALNGAILHEYYFDNLGGSKTPPSDLVKSVMMAEFGTWANYVNHLTNLGLKFRGWVMTAYNMRDNRVHNYALDAHNDMTPMGVVPLMVMDVYEHAYMVDYGTNRKPYLDAFLANVNWAVVDTRLQQMLVHGKK